MNRYEDQASLVTLSCSRPKKIGSKTFHKKHNKYKIVMWYRRKDGQSKGHYVISVLQADGNVISPLLTSEDIILQWSNGGGGF